MSMPSSNYNARQKIEGRNFQVILYPDSTSYDIDICFNNLKSNWATYYYIYHDNDTYTNSDIFDYDLDESFVGTLKKPHYHFIGISSNPCLLGNATKKFGLKCSQDESDMSHFVQKIIKLSSSVRYLSHIDYPDKFQYDWHTIVTNRPTELAKFFKGTDFNRNVQILFDFICNSNISDMRLLTEFALKEGIVADLVRAQSILKPLLYQNSIYKKETDQIHEFIC